MKPLSRQALTGPLYACSALAALVVLAPGAQAAAPLPFTLEMSSGATYSSALYSVAAQSNDQAAKSLAAWDALGRDTRTAVEILPKQADGFHFEQDMATAWSRFVQPVGGADGTLRSHARVSGYYLDGGSSNGAGNSIHLLDTVSIENAGAGAYFNLVQTTHGRLLSGGLSNAVTASARERTIYLGGCFAGCYEVDRQMPLQGLGGVWEGSVSVYARDATPTVTVLGDWIGSTHAITAAVPGFVDAFQGIELSSLLGTQSIYLAPGAKMLIDIDFEGSYGVASGSGSGYLSFGEADFSGTGLLSYIAVDADTGLPASGVSFRLLASAPVPEPGSVPMVLLGLVALSACHTRSRRHDRPRHGVTRLRTLEGEARS